VWTELSLPDLDIIRDIDITYVLSERYIDYIKDFRGGSRVSS
jgi:hypothetical protein